MKANILQYLRDRAKEYACSVCGANHSGSEIKLLGRVESKWIVRVTCGSCKTEFRMIAIVDEAKSVAMKQDHPSAALRRPPVTVDEVLDTHEFLSSYNGSLGRLLAPKTARD